MERNIEQLINILLHKSEQLEEEIKQKTDLKILTSKQLYCIELIHEMHNPTPSELAKRLGITRPSATVMIERLFDKGFLIRVKSDRDRRSSHLHLTTRGAKAARLHLKVHKAFANRLTENLTQSEENKLVALLNKSIKSFT